MSISDSEVEAHALAALTSRGTINPKFAIVFVPGCQSRGGGDVALLMNKEATRKTLVQHPEVFSLPAEPIGAQLDTMLAQLCSPDIARMALSNDVMLGTLLGFGASNAVKFAVAFAARDLFHPALGTSETSTQLTALRLDGWVRSYGARMWDSDETTALANKNVATALSINERIDALHADASRQHPGISKGDVLMQMALNTLFAPAEVPAASGQPGHAA